MFYRLSKIIFALCLLSFFAQAQTPSPTPVTTGKSYSSLDIPRPTTTAPQFPSPVTFTDISAVSGINFKHVASVTSIKYLPETMGAGVALIDFDNDGRLDLLVAQSHVLPTIEKTTAFLKYKQTPLLMQNTEKGFQNISFAAGEVFQKDFAARGMACGDLDNDGDTDIVISQTDGGALILKNNGTKNHWIGLDLRGDKSSPNGEGSRIVVTDSKDKKQIFDVSNSGSYLAANDLRVLVGLGENTSVKSVEIRGPSGKTQKIENLEIDRYLQIREK